ncbi:hypothetical protein BWQ96_06385 [Gracilariopsis chorda]|uniref:Uncharacterized protein n=1 Tax=Gracilariopsis chorda TaxID=448386 RepID=A0A2V3IPE5_9FLOR|nr:hypothetical protein BWQ96_06385 [Gracilariopsis chorda]|eukprot:PXF43919.1 hypothetical protein BWQ96_06385 [Gracilariopsis chorda]
MLPSIETIAFLPLCPTSDRRLVCYSRPELSRRRPRRSPVTSPPPLACTSFDKDIALQKAKAAYKAAKAEYKILKAKYKILKQESAQLKDPLPKESNRTPVTLKATTKAHSNDAVAVCNGKSCCRMGADAVAMLIGKNIARAPCMKMCGGVGPSVKQGDTVVKVDLKKAVQDAVATSTEHGQSDKCGSTSTETLKISAEVIRDKIAV